jgi:hypothetical protein
MFFSNVVPETWSLITTFIDDILDELYDHALAHETTAKLFAGHNSEGLKAVQKSHWELTFKNGFDTSYEEPRTASGSPTRKSDWHRIFSRTVMVS